MKQAMIDAYKMLGYWMQSQRGEELWAASNRRSAIAARFLREYGENISDYVTGVKK